MFFIINLLRHSRRHGAARARDFFHGLAFTGSVLSRMLALSLFFAMPAGGAHADPRDELAQARHDLFISEQVLARVSERVRTARSDPATAPEERKRLDEYLVRVRDLVALNRERVRSLEKTAAAPPAGMPAGGTASGIPSATTHAEEVAALDAKLSGSLADFDALLLEEARKARSRAPTRASATGLAGSSGGGANGSNTQQSGRDGGKETERTASSQQKTETASSSTTSRSAGGRIEGADPGVTGVPGAASPPPPDVGDGRDDDIVARQIRRAAELESDPELRKKLWDEYRKYKEGTKG